MKMKCIKTKCPFYDRTQDNRCASYRDLKICADFKNDKTEASETTCNLCSERLKCSLRREIINVLEIQRALGTLHNDFDDIMVDLAAICLNFTEEK